MAVGGARKGAGRKQGSATAKTRDIADKACAEGLTPLEYLLSVMRDANKEDAQRIDCAKSAAPYIHPRLSTIEANVQGQLDLTARIINELVRPAHPDR